MATEIEVTFAKSQSLPDTVPEGRLQLVDESAGATEVEAYVGTQNGTKKITDKDKASIEALKDGTIVPKLAENLTPYAEDSGTTQTQPFFLEGTATGNGESRVDAKQVPAFAFLQEKRGNMVCVNQQLTNPDFATSGADWSAYYYGGVKSWNNGILTISRTGDTCDISQAFQAPIPTGHTLLFIARLKTNNANSVYFGGSGSTLPSQYFQSKTSFDTYSYVGTLSGTLSRMYLACMAFDSTTETVMDVDYIYCIDLTQWFNGNIPAYLLSHPETFGRYYKGSLAYEPGRLEPATGRYLTSVGRNIWDEEWELGYIDNQGVLQSSDSYIRSKNYISVSSITEYFLRTETNAMYFTEYDAEYNFIKQTYRVNTTITTQPNTVYVKFYMGGSYGTTYKHDITISEYYPSESGYDKYYPYEVLATIDTGTESLYSAGSAYDSKVSSGLITRRIGSVDLGTLDWLEGSVTSRFYCQIPGAGASSGQQTALCSRYLIKFENEDKVAYFSVNERFVVNDSAYTDAASFKAAMSGVMLYYELATPTTEQGTPFQESISIDDFGQLSWSNTDVPQGNQIFYPVDYKAYEDTLIKYTDGDATSLAKKSYVDSLIGDINTVLDSVNGVVI